MRKVVIASAAAASLLLAGAYAFKIDRAGATTGAGTLGLPEAAKTYSPIQKVGCKGQGVFCKPGYVIRCNPWCKCQPC